MWKNFDYQGGGKLDKIQSKNLVQGALKKLIKNERFSEYTFNQAFDAFQKKKIETQDKNRLQFSSDNNMPFRTCKYNVEEEIRADEMADFIKNYYLK